MSSIRAPSNQGIVSLTRKRRASIPSVPSMTSVAKPSQSAVTTSPSSAATTISSARTDPLAV
jgi:hypothetical protein